MDRWEITEGDKGWSVYRNNRIVRYDCFDVDDALREVKRKAGPGVKVDVYDIDENRSSKTTR